MSPAATTIEVTLQPIGGRGPLRAAVLLGAAAVTLVSSLLHDPHLPATTRVVVRRRSDGELLARGAVDREHLVPLYERMRAALESDSEAEFLERWSDPTTWTALALG